MARPEQLPFDLGHRQAYAREDFWVSSSNREAVAWLDRWPDWPAPALIIFGPPASGKTHLLQVWKKEAEAAEIPAHELASRSAPELAGTARAVMIDDVRQAIGRRGSEETLFHLYNLLRERGGHLLLTASTAPVEWPFVLPDLKSRLLAAPVAALHSPDDQLMAVVLSKLFSDRQIFVPQEVLQYILARVERSFLALRQAADRIDRKALSEKRAVTIPLVKEIL